MQLPEKIREIIGGYTYQTDGIGQSGSDVLVFADMVLKVRPETEAARQEARMLLWLQGKLPVPRVLAREGLDGRDFLLMSRCPGEMACARAYMENPREQVKLLAQGLRMLWEVDIQGCPVDWSLDVKLAEARRRVELGLVDMENTQPGTFGPGGFRDPRALLEWLEANRPEEETVLSHGDYCLPNVFFRDGQVSGFIDLDRCGTADKWWDIALCQRSLENNFGGVFDGITYTGWEEDMLFRELDMVPDREKLRYYILLDELF